MDRVAQMTVRAVDDASQVINKIRETAVSAAQTMQESFNGLETIGKGLGIAGAAITGMFTLLTKSTAEYNLELQRTLAMTGKQGQALDEMAVKVMGLGDTLQEEFGVKGVQAQNAFYYVLSTGVEAGSKGFNTLAESAFKLSKVVGPEAGGLSEVVTQLADTTKTFGGEMENTAHTAEVFYKAAQMSNITVGELAASLRVSGGAARVAGVSLEEASAILAVMGDNGQKAEIAGTGLRQMLIKLAAPSVEAQKALDKLGVSIFDGAQKSLSMTEIVKEMGVQFRKLSATKKLEFLEAMGADIVKTKKGTVDFVASIEKLQDSMKKTGMATTEQSKAIEKLGVQTTKGAGKMRNFIDIVLDMKGRLGELSQQEQLVALRAIFGEEAIKGFTSAIGKGSENLRKYVEDLKNAKMLSEGWNNIKKQLAIQFDILVAKVEIFGRQIASILAPAITDIVIKIQKFVDSVREWIRQNPELSNTIVIWTAVGGVILTALGGITTAVGVVGAAIAGIILAMNTAAGVVTGVLFAGIVTAFAGITAALLLLRKAWDEQFLGIHTAANILWQRIKEGWNKLWVILSPLVNRIANTIKDIWQGLSDTVGRIVQNFIVWLFNNYGRLEKEILPIIQTFVTNCLGLWDKFNTEILPILSDFWEALKRLWDIGIKKLQELWNKWWPELKKEWDKFNNETVPAIKKFMEEVHKKWNEWKPKIEKLINDITKKIAEIKAAVQKCVDDTKPIWEEFLKWWKKKNDDEFPKLFRGFESVSNEFTGLVEELTNTVMIIFETFFPSLQSTVESGYGGILNTSLYFGKEYRTFWDAIIGFLNNTILPLVEMFINGFKRNWGTLNFYLKEWLPKFKKTLDFIFKDPLGNITIWLLTDFLPSIQRAWGKIMEAILNKIKEKWMEIKAFYDKNIKPLLDNIDNFLHGTNNIQNISGGQGGAGGFQTVGYFGGGTGGPQTFQLGTIAYDEAGNPVANMGVPGQIFGPPSPTSNVGAPSNAPINYGINGVNHPPVGNTFNGQPWNPPSPGTQGSFNGPIQSYPVGTPNNYSQVPYENVPWNQPATGIYGPFAPGSAYSNTPSRSGVTLQVGTLIADESSLREFERKLSGIASRRLAGQGI